MKGSCIVGKPLDVVVEMFRAYLLGQGWSIVEEKDLQNGLQLLVTDGMTKVPIDCYTNGNALIQGPAGVLKTELQTWWKQQKASPSAPILQDGVVPPSLRTTVEKFRTFALSQGWSIAGRAIHNGIYLPHSAVWKTVFLDRNACSFCLFCEMVMLAKKRHASRSGMKNRCCTKGSPQHERHTAACPVDRSGVDRGNGFNSRQSSDSKKRKWGS